MSQFNFALFPTAGGSGQPRLHGEIRQQPSHFQVDEILPFTPDGSGSHVWLNIEKTATNTGWLAQELASFAGVPAVAVGYAGLKDRQAVTRQWFSINMQGHVEPDWEQLDNEFITIKQRTRHNKKLKRGALRGNHFQLVLTNVDGERGVWEQALQRVRQFGVPNYFAEQRFGHQGNNLVQAQRWFESGHKPKNRQQRSLYLSAARSWLFNQLLAQRINDHNWDQPILGDVLLLAGTKASFFVAETIDQPLIERVKSHDVSPTGPLWGRGELPSRQQAQQLELATLNSWQLWRLSLEQKGLTQQRRALRVIPTDFNWQFSTNQLTLKFSLPAGSYATALLRELADIIDLSKRNDAG